MLESTTKAPEKPFFFNKAQRRIVLMRPKKCTTNLPRGGGKSTIIGYLLKTCSVNMPRAAATYTTATYAQALTKTLPSTIASLEKLGYYQDKHFWIGHKPPAKYKIPLPIERPQDFKHFITFYTGFGCHLLSQDRSTSPRGLNTDVQLTEESHDLDINKFTTETLGTNRGNEEHFGKFYMHHGIYHFSSMPPTTEGNWLLKESEYYDRDGHDFTTVKNMIIKLQLSFIRNKDRRIRMELWREIQELDKKLTFYPHYEYSPEEIAAGITNKRKGGTLYHEAHAFDNLMNLGIGYLEQTYREMAPLMFLVEMMGMRLKKVDGGFYPTFDRSKHGYKGHYNYALLDDQEFNFKKIKNLKCELDADCNPQLPLTISVDWGGKINFMVVAQKIDGPRQQINFINNVHAKHPEILDDLFNKFCNYYSGHRKKVVYFYYDRNGNQKLANSKLTFAEQGAKILRARGWTVIMMSAGSNPFHNDKYLLMGKIFKQAHLPESQQDPRFPIVKFNLIQCSETVISLEQAKIKQTTDEIKKDKSGELRDTVDQEEETHASDCVDNILFHSYKQLIDTNSRYLPPTIR